MFITSSMWSSCIRQSPCFLVNITQGGELDFSLKFYPLPLHFSLLLPTNTSYISWQWHFTWMNSFLGWYPSHCNTYLTKLIGVAPASPRTWSILSKKKKKRKKEKNPWLQRITGPLAHVFVLIRHSWLKAGTIFQLALMKCLHLTWGNVQDVGCTLTLVTN